MKKLLILLLVISAIVFSLSGCDDENEPDPTPPEITYETGEEGLKFLNMLDVGLLGSVWAGTSSTHMAVSGVLDPENIVSVKIPDTYEEKPIAGINARAFKDCIKLSRVYIPDSVYYISWEAFYGCENLTDINIHDGIIEIRESAFYNCKSLDNVTMPMGIIKIGNKAFYNCEKFDNITLPDRVVEIGSGAFFGTAHYNNEANWENGALYIGKHLIRVKEDYQGEFEIKEGTLTVACGAFANCTGVTSVVIPDSVVHLSEMAFYNCGSLTSVTIGNGITTLPYGVFANCISLPHITIGRNISSIGEQAFDGCESLCNITVSPENTTYHQAGKCLIETKSKTVIFMSSESIIPTDGSVTSIGDYACCNNSRITDLDIPDIITSIGLMAFYGCENLEKITLPESIAHIGEYAFTSTGYYNYEDNWQDGVLYIQSHLIKADPDKLPSEYSIKEGTTLIAETAFQECTGLTAVDFPLGLKHICERAFYHCPSLTSISIPESIKTIEDNAFGFCSKLSSISIPDCIVSIHTDAFQGTEYYKNKENWTEEHVTYEKDMGNGFVAMSGETCSVLYIENHAITSKSPMAKVKEGTYTIADGVGVSLAFWLDDMQVAEGSIIIPTSVKHIGSLCTNEWGILITGETVSTGDINILYEGTADQWAEISINEVPTVHIHVYLYSETEPDEEGNFWHYDEDGNVKIWE